MIPMGRNNTMENVLAGLEQYVGADVKDDVYAEAKRQVEWKIRRVARIFRGGGWGRCVWVVKMQSCRGVRGYAKTGKF